MREVTEYEKEAMRELCTDHQIIDMYCDDPQCEEGCVGCQRRWLRLMGWKEEELPTEHIDIFGSKKKVN